VFDATHVFGTDLNCLDCAEAWPCPGYQDLVCSVFADDMDLVTEFMRFFVPDAGRVLSGMSAKAVEQRVVGWCELRRRSRPASAPRSPVGPNPPWVTTRSPSRPATEARRREGGRPMIRTP
jgi:hypothetical protein